MKLAIALTVAAAMLSASLIYTGGYKGGVTSPAQAAVVQTSPGANTLIDAISRHSVVSTELPTVLGGRAIDQNGQRVLKCLIEKGGDKLACGMNEIMTEISKCVGGIGNNGGCFVPQAQAPAPAKKAAAPKRTTPSLTSSRFTAAPGLSIYF